MAIALTAWHGYQHEKFNSLEASLFRLCAGTEDKKEGTQAFLQKRAGPIPGTVSQKNGKEKHDGKSVWRDFNDR